MKNLTGATFQRIACSCLGK